ncbi:MAG TPA: hypothetical protein VHB20_04345 [Verrucomicrobiae bacterium]|jgi:hypothetical protein|nr:hypothetical protein [Verrucomicrobiae bacterium]
MNADALRGLVNHDPFQPFTLRLNDGRKIRVPHRSFITISKDGRTFTTFGGTGSCDTIEVILVAGCQVDDGTTIN